MARWDNTAFFRTRNKSRLEEAIRYCCSRYGYSQASTVPLITEKAAREMQYGKSTESAIWAFAWLPTVSEWTIVKTAPFELLCEYPRGYLRPRLGVISMLLGCSAVQINLYDGAGDFDPGGGCERKLLHLGATSTS